MSLLRPLRVLAILVWVVLFVFPAAVEAGDKFIALQVPEGTPGCQEHGGPIGMDFDVEVDIQATRLGVFDDMTDGLKRTITARLYDRDTQVEVATLVFTPEDPGELIGGYWFKELDSPYEMPAGFHGTISADGYGVGERNGNDWCRANVVDGGRCALTFVGLGRWSTVPGEFPTTIDTGPAYRYLSGSFEFEQLEEPVPTGGTAIVVPEFTVGNSTFSGVRGMDFDALTDLEVTRLGVFDSASDGFLTTVTAILYDRDSRKALASIEFSEADPGELVGGSRFKDLDPPLAIPAGTLCTIAAEGYGDLEMAGENLVGPTIEHGGCMIRPGAWRASYEATGFPSYLAMPSYTAGTFVFRPPAAQVPTPQPPTGVTAANAGGQAQISWVAPAAGPTPAGYNVYRISPGDLTKLNGDPVAGTTFLVAREVQGAEVCYVVRSVLASSVQGPASATACVVLPAPAAPGAKFVAFQAPEGSPGNQQDYQGLIGTEFFTNTEIVITRLGVFDDLGDGLAQPLIAHVVNRATRGIVVSLAFSPAEPGDLQGAFRLKALPAPLGLPAGFEGIVAVEGYGPLDKDGNSQFGPVVQAFDDGGCAITPGSARWGPSGQFPLYGTSNTHVAATFEYSPVGAIPAQPSSGIAYRIPAGTIGNQPHVGAIGMDFSVEKSIVITRLGVFDDRQDGLMQTITAYLFNRDTAELLRSIVFTPEDPGDLVEGSRFKELDEPITLATGFQGTISADGYGELERNGNQANYGFVQPPPWTTFDGGCRLRFVGGGRFDAGPGVFPRTLDAGTANRYASGTFEFEAGPEASFTASPTEGFAPFTVAFDASASSSPHGGIAAYTWDFGDGGTGSGATISHEFTKAGHFTVKLTVRDGSGYEASTTRTIVAKFQSGDVAPWISEDIGEVVVEGGAQMGGGAGCMEVYAGGRDIGGVADSFHYVYQQVSGNVALSARIAAAEWPSNARAGLMIRQDLTPGSKEASVLLFNSTTLKCYFLQRKTANSSTSLPVESKLKPTMGDVWLRIERTGGDVVALISGDGTTYEAVSTTNALGLIEPFHIGFAVTARDNTDAHTSALATFCDIRTEGMVEEKTFRRGDADGKGGVPNITDGIYVLNFLFLGGPEPPCKEAANADDKGDINITDGIYILNYLFQGGPAPPAPGPDSCGPEPANSQDDVGCEAYTSC